MEYASCIADAVQLVLALEDPPEESLAEAVRSRAALMAHISQEDATQPD